MCAAERIDMDFLYETKHLYIRTLIDDDAGILLDYCKRNAGFFSEYETEYPENYFTEEYQRMLIKGYMQQFLKSTGVRYYLFEKDNDERIVGTVGLSRIICGEERSAVLSYKLDRDFCGKGYATEACAELLNRAAKGFRLHRIEADILPGNVKSVAVAERLGFKHEGKARLSHRVGNAWADHERYSLIIGVDELPPAYSRS
jgi:ribosomal-protein-alanine N-acetyltransferase